MTIVRHATEEDRFGLFRLAVDMHAETDFAGLAFDPERALNGLGGWIHGDGGLMLVAESGGEIVGMLAAAKKVPWFTSDVIASEDLFFVRKDFRGSPCAFRLMKAFLAWAEDRGAVHVRAGIATGDPGSNADRLYLHFGFHKVGGCYSLFPGRDTSEIAK